MKTIAIALLGSALSLAAEAAQAAPEIRFCPKGGAWTLPLEEARRVRSLVLQSVTVANPDGAAFQVQSAEIALMAGESARDIRYFGERELTAAAAGAGGVEMLNGLLPGQYCSGASFGGLKLAKSPTIAGGEALVINQQSFAWGGTRDAVRVTVRGLRDGKPVELVSSIPIRTGASKTALRFPMAGGWTIGSGPTNHSPHRWVVFEEFAYDISRQAGAGLTYKGSGQKFTDYYAYGAPVLAAADGTVAAAHDGVAEDSSIMRRPDESQEAYLTRLLAGQGERMAAGPNAIIGNHVVLNHGNGEFSIYAHLKPGSVEVRKGQAVKAGAALGRLGSSGNSTEPHLHFQVCDTPDPMACAAIPPQFVNVEIPVEFMNRTLQTGDVVVAK